MNEFITIDIAQKLKTKGFPQGNEDDITKLYYQISDNLQSAIMLSEGKDVKWYCPTISEVMKWLRDTHNIHINVYFFRFNANTELYWVFSVENIEEDSDYDLVYSSRHNSYEKAAMAGIEWVLDNILI